MSTSRSYDSSRRSEAARLTRRRIVEAARQEFLSTGYHGTTIGALAKAAEVSPQTIYNTCGSKADVLKTVYDILLAGDDEEVVMNDRPEIARILSQRSTSATLRAYAGFSAMIVGRVGPLIGMVLAEGAGSDADLGAFLSTIDGERRAGNTGIVRHLADRFGLPDGVPIERAVDHVWTLTSIEVADRLVRRCGWSLDAYERWLGEGLISGLRALDR
jgi:AcrR family transcriptional regulator